MEAKKLLESLKALLESQKRLLLTGIKDKETIEKLKDLDERKLEVLTELSKKEKEEFSSCVELVKVVEKLNKEVEILLMNNLDFIEGILKELCPESDITYGSSEKGKGGFSLFNKKI
ncbi:MAG: hypothetical protein ABGX27_00495 [Desulfurobacteriaceae bacterium]